MTGEPGSKCRLQIALSFGGNRTCEVLLERTSQCESVSVGIDVRTDAVSRSSSAERTSHATQRRDG